MSLKLDLRQQTFTLDDEKRSLWRSEERAESIRPDETALILCDVWDDHWSRGAAERLDAMIPRMNRTVAAARDAGVTIVHAPSGTMDVYEETPARKRILEADPVEPVEVEHEDPPLPVDDTDKGSDTGETKSHRAWSSQHPGIEIDQDRDLISDDGREVYSYLNANGISTVLILGVHTNMCVLHRSFGIKQMVRWGIRPILVRDLTDSLYNPAMSPYVSHDEGTRLVVEFIEKFWCPSTTSGSILGD